MSNTDVVLRFENEFKNKANLDVTDELMAADFVHNLPFPGMSPGRAGMKDVGHLVFGAIGDIKVKHDLVLSEGDLVAVRTSAKGVRKSNSEPTSWHEHNIYRVQSGKIVEMWPMVFGLELS